MLGTQGPWRLPCGPQNSLHLSPHPPLDDGKMALKTGETLVRVTQRVSGAKGMLAFLQLSHWP